MSKRHHATRRRSYGRRQHELHQRDDLARQPGVGELTDQDSAYDLAFRGDRAEARFGGSRWAGMGEPD